MTEETPGALRACLENALQAMSSVAGRLRVIAPEIADEKLSGEVLQDGYLLAALCPPTRRALEADESARVAGCPDEDPREVTDAMVEAGLGVCQEIGEVLVAADVRRLLRAALGAVASPQPDEDQREVTDAGDGEQRVAEYDRLAVAAISAQVPVSFAALQRLLVYLHANGYQISESGAVASPTGNDAGA